MDFKVCFIAQNNVVCLKVSYHFSSYRYVWISNANDYEITVWSKILTASVGVIHKLCYRKNNNFWPPPRSWGIFKVLALIFDETFKIRFYFSFQFTKICSKLRQNPTKLKFSANRNCSMFMKKNLIKILENSPSIKSITDSSNLFIIKIF